MNLRTIKAALEKPGKTRVGLARAMGVQPSAITALLDGDRRLQADEIPKVRAYLEMDKIPIMGRIGAGAAIEPEFEQVPPEGLDAIELPFSLPEDLIAFEVKGDSMLPRYDDGDVVVVSRESRRSVESFYGQEAAVRTKDGRRFLKTITRGKGKTLTLSSFNAKPMEDVPVEWIGEIHLTLRAGQVRRSKKLNGA